MNQNEQEEQELIQAYQAEWGHLVGLVVRSRATGKPVNIPRISMGAKKGPGAIVAKVRAIYTALEQGVPAEQIIQDGESQTLSVKAQKIAKESDGMVGMNFRVRPDVRDGAMQVFERLVRVCELKTREEVWDLLCSMFVGADAVTDNEIKHHAGMRQ